MCEFDGGLISILHHEEPLQNEPCYMSADVCKLPLELYTRNMSCSERLDIYKKNLFNSNGLSVKKCRSQPKSSAAAPVKNKLCLGTWLIIQ